MQPSTSTPVRLGNFLRRGILRVRPWAAALTAALLLANCGGGDDGPTAPPEQVASVVISGVPTENVVLAGATAQLAAQPRSAGGQALERTVTWQSSNLGVATVSPTGLVTGAAPGAATITATSEGATASVVLSVRSPVTVPPATATTPVTTTVLGGAVTLTIPPAATTSTAQLTVAPAPTAPADPRAVSGTAFVFGPSGTQFTTPITLELSYNPAAVPANKIEDLRIYLVEPSGALTLVPGGSVDAANNRVSAPIVHFSTYTIAAPADPAEIVVTAGAAQTAGINTAVPTAPAVTVRDAQGRPVPFADVTFAVVTGGGSLTGATSVETNAQGVATLPGSWVLGPASGTNTISAVVDGTELVALINATATAPATQLIVFSQPAVANSGIPLNSVLALRVRVADAFNSTVTSSTASITAEVVSGTGSLIGTATETAVDGIATFRDLSIGGAGLHRLRFVASGLTPDTTDVIEVFQGVNAIVVTTPPSGATSNSPFAQQPVVELRDHADLRVLGGGLQVRASLASGTGVLYGTTTVTAVDGIATFTDLAIEGSGAHSLRFETIDNPTFGDKVVTSASFDVTALPPGIRANAGASPQATVAPGAQIAVPVLVDLTNRGADDIASLTVTLSWNPEHFDFAGDLAGNWSDDATIPATVITNGTNTASGSFSISGFTTGATTTSFTLHTISLTARQGVNPTTSPVTLTIGAAGNAAGSAITVTPRSLAVTIATP